MNEKGRMQAVQVYGWGSAAMVAAGPVPTPSLPGQGEIEVRVAAAGLNPNDVKLRSGAVPLPSSISHPYVSGREAAGHVTRCGAGVTDLSVDDAVFGFFRWDAAPGGHAERFVAPSARFARVPDPVDLHEAGGAALTGTTAWQALAQLDAPAGAVVLVNGAGGGVGSLATQMAIARGLTVVAIASNAKAAFVATLGAEHVVDYEEPNASGRLRAVVGSISYVVDTVGGAALHGWVGALDREVRIAQVASPADLPFGHEQRVTAEPSRDALEQIGGLLQRGALRCHVSASLPFSRAAEAHRLVEAGHTRGKVVLVPDP